MDLSEAAPLLTENHTGVIITVGPTGRAQSTVVSTAFLDGKVAVASRGGTVKLRNIQRNGRATITVIKLDTRRYVTVEGPTTVQLWDGSDVQIQRLKDVYVAMGRAPKDDQEFAKAMGEEQRAVVMVTPERVYGSLRQNA